MHDMALESGAYRLTELKSERMRTGALIVLGVVFVAVVLLRDVMFGSEESRASLPSLLLLLAAFMLFETWMLWRVAGALATESSLPNGTRSLKVVVEALVPTAATVLATMAPYLGPYRALTGPAQEVDLETGDMLVLITDGFFEWEDRDGEPVWSRPARERHSRPCGATAAGDHRCHARRHTGVHQRHTAGG